MSRVGKHPIVVPSGVKTSMEGSVFVARSEKEEFRFPVPDTVKVSLEGSKISFTGAGKDKKAKQMWGTVRAIVNNGVLGLATPFYSRVELVGVGYKASMQDKNLVLQLGYSHDVVFSIPEGISVKCEKPTTILVGGADKRKVGQAVRELQNLRKLEPYKGKGVIKEGQHIIRKEGKKK
ncbi:MAG: 50S ribosomal protein L6 [Holosporales bacterium]|jgi:large subunit ribosomal protein L6|nr:50S ribosomal protein L6 [Holosporales bacterium]